jgi:archaellum biogenesis protein FlaJ (TadC family)
MEDISYGSKTDLTKIFNSIISKFKNSMSKNSTIKKRNPSSTARGVSLIMIFSAIFITIILVGVKMIMMINGKH